MTYVPVYGPCCRLVIVKAFPYRGETSEEFSNDYTFAPINTPTTDAQWLAFANFIVGQEQAIYPTNVHWHRVYGYSSNDPHEKHVYLRDYEAEGNTPPGLYTPEPGAVKGAGDQAACVEWLHSNTTATGKPLYFRKFHHEPWIQSGGGDSLDSHYLLALQTYGETMRTYLGGPYSTKYPTGTSTTSKVLTYVTTRTLKRRGKRPLPAAATSSAS